MMVRAAAEVAPVVMVVGGSLSPPASTTVFFFSFFSFCSGGTWASTPSSVRGWVGSYKYIPSHFSRNQTQIWKSPARQKRISVTWFLRWVSSHVTNLVRYRRIFHREEIVLITFSSIYTMTLVTLTIRSAEEILVIANIVENVVALVVINTHGLNRTVMSPIRFHVGLQNYNSFLVLERNWTQTKDKKNAVKPQSVTYIFHEIPVENVIIREALSVEEVSDQLSQVSIVRLLLKPERTDIVVVSGKLGWKEKRKTTINLSFLAFLLLWQGRIILLEFP